jgi:hypothetical protein
MLAVGIILWLAPTARLDPTRYLDDATAALSDGQVTTAQQEFRRNVVLSHLHAAREVSKSQMTSSEAFGIRLSVLAVANLGAYVLLFVITLLARKKA